MAGLRDRLLRHPSDQKKRRWHIDYFLNDKQARIKKIFLYLAAPGQDAVSRTSPPVYFSTVHSVSAPDFPRAAWKVHVEGDLLTIKAERKAAEKGPEYRETFYGKFERAVTLPHGVKAENIAARYEHGVLELVVPLPVELAGKKIPIQIEAGKTIESKAA